MFIYVQHLLGSGHLQRMARIAQALAARGVRVDLCSGGMPLAALDPAPARLHQLPPARCEAHDFTRLLDGGGAPVTERWRAVRRARLCELAAQIAPAVALIESYPFARRQMRFELQPLLGQLRAGGCRIACSVRDILQIKRKPERRVETLGLLRAYFDAVLVHGDPALCPLELSFAGAADIAPTVYYTGYVAAQDAPLPAPGVGADEVLVAAGGGAVGEALFRAALQARGAGCQARRHWRVLAGAALPPAAWARLRAAVPGGLSAGDLTLEPARADYPHLLRRAAASVSQAGYNTTVDLLAAGCPAVLVPYARHGETEQILRARQLACRGLAVVVEEAELGAASLAQALERVLARPRPAAVPALDLDGAARTAELVGAWLRGAA